MIKKVCHVTSVHKPSDGRIFERECTSLARQYEVYLLAPNTKSYKLNGVNVVGVSLPGSRLKRIISLNVIKKKALEINADVYHFHDPELIPIGVALKRKGKVVVFDSHENVPVLILGKTYIPSILRRIISSVYECYEKWSLKKYDALVTVTPEIVERLKKINPNTYLLTNYPIYEDYSSNRTWERKICFAGLISPIWMLENVLKAIEDIDVIFELAGPVSDDYLTHLKSLPGWKRVNYHGIISHQEVIKLMGSCTVGMAVAADNNPNINGKKGSIGVTKVFEYMMAGIPVIATNLESWVPIIDGTSCGICVDCHNIDAIKNSIEYCLINIDKAKQMGDNGISTVRNEYCWQKQENSLYALYSFLDKCKY